MQQSFGVATRYAGTISAPGAPTPVTVAIELDASGVVAHLPDGGRQRIEYADLEVDTGGFEGDFLFLKPRSGAFVLASNAAGLADALAHSGGAMLAPTVAKLGKQRGARHRSRKIGIAVTLLAVVLVVLFVWNIPNMLAASVGFLPIELDRKIGDLAMADEGALGAPVHDATLDAFITATLARLGPSSADPRFELRATVVANEEINAFALPGGKIVVFTGLLAAAESEEEVAGVLAHEIAHVTERHGLRNVAHNAATYVLLSWLLGDASALAQLAGQLAAASRTNAYSRGEEAEADEEGVRTLIAAGIDPGGLARFFRTMKRQEGADADVLEWLSTHPDTDSRIEDVERLVREHGPVATRPIGLDFAAVRAAAALHQPKVPALPR